MKLKTKRKIKRGIAWILGILLLVIALIYAYFKGKVIETIITIITYYIFRSLYDKQWHSKSVYICFCISSFVLFVIINVEMKITISILSSVIITFILTLLSYYVRDYSDIKIELKLYKNKINSFKRKRLEELKEEELLRLLPNIRQDTIHIVYGYIHRQKGLTANEYAYKCNISEPLVYKYVKQVKDAYKSLT